MSDKPFDAADVQRDATLWRKKLTSKIFRHWKGPLYCVTDVTVDEETGKILVHYISTDPGSKLGWTWTRTLDAFLWRDKTDEQGERLKRFEVVDTLPHPRRGT